MSKDGSIVYQKAFDFAVKIVKLYQFLSNEKKEFVISKQILKAGTSVGSNVREGLEGQSKKDFIAKMSIALKEAGETEYWLDLLIACKIVKLDEVSGLKEDAKELIKILNSIIITSKRNLSHVKSEGSTNH